MKPFHRSFTQKEALPSEVLNAAVFALYSGRLIGYDTTADGKYAVTALPKANAGYEGVKYCLACTSDGCAHISRIIKHCVSSLDLRGAT